MMREILFRAKEIKTGDWIEGFYTHFHKTTHCCAADDGGNNDVYSIRFESMTDWELPNDYIDWEVDPNTVGEFTGAVDKNKKEIFEGDIVLYKTAKGDYRKSLIVWKMYCFCANAENSYDCPALDLVMCECDGDIEVIGNIHDDLDKFDMLKE